jgi:chemotaxis protein methyltransferase CheR
VTRQDLQQVAALCAEHAGLRVDPEKEYLIENRLGPVARREGFGSIPDLLQAVRDRGDERLVWAVVEGMSPAETAFFRDPSSLDQAIGHALADLARRGEGQTLRIWVAACGAGQEIYSVAMLLDEHARPGVTIDLCASDLSDRRLEKARSGVYSQFEVQRGLPAQRLVRHFEKRDDSFVIVQRLRQAVRWRRVNVLEDLSQLGPFDLVFCRNVLGGMLEAGRTQALRNLRKVLTPEGYLVLGLGEAAGELTTLAGQPGLYRAQAGRRAA